jgi:hypothetical protein
VVTYSLETNTTGLRVLEQGLALLENVQTFLQSIQFECDEILPANEQPPDTTLMNNNQGKMNKKLKNLITDVIYHIDNLGMFGGSQACLAHIIQLERILKKAQDSITKSVFRALIDALVAVR